MTAILAKLTKTMGFYIIMGGGSFLIYILQFLALYIGIKICIFALKHRGDISNTDSLRETKEFLKTFIKIQTILVLGFIIMGAILMPIVTNTQKNSIAENSNKMMSIDKAIFGTYPALYMQSVSNPYKPYWDAMGKILVRTYTLLTIVLSFIFLWHITTNQRLFASMAVSFFLCTVIGAPFWYFFPAFTPGERYIDKQNSRSISGSLPANISSAIAEYQPNQNILQLRKGINARKDAQGNQFVDVTVLPSMHVAWALVALYFGARACKKLLYILIPFFILTVISTMYTLQHFGIDAIGGIFVAIVAIATANKMTINIEKNGGLTFFIKKDIDSVIKLISKIYGKYIKQPEA